MEAETTTSKLLNGGKTIIEQTLVSRKKEIQKSRAVKITVWDESRKLNHLSKVI